MYIRRNFNDFHENQAANDTCFIGILSTGCVGQNHTDFATIPALAFAEKIKNTPEGQILDVRTPEEYNGQHLDNAKNIDWNGNDFAGKVLQLDKTKPVFVYCMAGGRSKSAAMKMHELGFTEIYNLDGGILKWNAAGLAPKSDKIIGMCPQEYGELTEFRQKSACEFLCRLVRTLQKNVTIHFENAERYGR